MIASYAFPSSKYQENALFFTKMNYTAQVEALGLFYTSHSVAVADKGRNRGTVPPGRGRVVGGTGPKDFLSG